MAQDISFEVVATHLGAGHFREARNELLRVANTRRTDPSHYDALLADTELQLGLLDSAAARAEAILREPQVSARHAAAAHRVLAEIAAGDLNFEASCTHYEAARHAYSAAKSNSLAASVELSFWARFSGVLPLETAVSEFRTVRTTVLRSGSPQHLAELRLCTARIEARKNCIIEAERHWQCAQRLLDSNPNAKLFAQSHLDACMLRILRADWDGALRHAEEASKAAEASGHCRSRVGALIDAAHILHARGELADAKQFAERALGDARSLRHLHVAALDCLANILLSTGDISGAEAACEQIANLRPRHGTRLASHWDVLSELATRVSIARSRNSHLETVELINQGLHTARASRDHAWLARMELACATELLTSGQANEAVVPLSRALSYDNPPPELLARVCATLDVASAALGENRSRAASQRGHRIAGALGSRVLEAELSQVGQRPTPPATVALSSLDDAVALIELAGYPHVLAREAYALLQLTGAASAVALVARSDRLRCIEAQGWTENHALRVAADPAHRLHIVCGQHREETWEIVAELKPALADRCAGVAVRKLVDTAVTLDRYRREEKQRLGDQGGLQLQGPALRP